MKKKIIIKNMNISKKNKFFINALFWKIIFTK